MDRLKKTTKKKKAPKKAPKKARRDAGRPRGQPIVDTVLDRTLEELAAHGLEGVSVDRIARAAGVNKTSVYRRFPTRDALVAAALARIHDDLAAKLTDTGSLRGDLMGLVRSVAAFVDDGVGRAVVRAVFAAPRTDDVADVARARFAAQAALPAQAMVARAIARGEWRDGVDPAVLLATLVGAILHRALLEQAPLDETWLQSVVDLATGGVAPRAPSPRR